jgi:adenine/guanine phosphoribosyltransferase-like PRPP-binding protein
VSAELDASRRRFEQSLDRLRDEIASEFGSAPRLGRWAVVLTAAAVGFLAGGALAGRLAARRKRRRLGA